MFWKRRVYLDAAAAVPVKKEAARAYARAAIEFGNPSSAHEEGRRAKDVLEDARRDIARLTEVKPDDVIFTSGATEANALVVLGLPKEGQHVLYLPSAHASVVENMNLLLKRDVVVEPLPIKNGRVDTDALRTMLRPNTVLISMDAVCGETGTIWNTREVAQAIKNADSRARLHVDASQTPLSEKLTRAHFSADLMTLDSGKAGGVRGMGCLIAHRTIPLAPLFGGGSQERGLRPGTENPALAAAFAAALIACARERDSFRESAEADRAFLTEFISTNIPKFHLNGGKETVPHILNISLLGRDTDYLVALLSEAGYAVATKSACETDSEEGSRAVFALSGDAERAKSTLRISWGTSVSRRDLERFARELKKEVVFLDRAVRQ